MRVGICVFVHVTLLSRLWVLEIGTSQWAIVSEIEDGIASLPIRDEFPSLVVASVVLVEDEVSV